MTLRQNPDPREKWSLPHPNPSFELRTRLQTVLWSVELLEMRLRRDGETIADRADLLREVQQIRHAVETTCHTCMQFSSPPLEPPPDSSSVCCCSSADS